MKVVLEDVRETGVDEEFTEVVLEDDIRFIEMIDGEITIWVSDPDPNDETPYAKWLLDTDRPAGAVMVWLLDSVETGVRDVRQGNYQFMARRASVMP